MNGLQARQLSDGHGVVRERLAIAQEMISTMETLTVSGQRFLMEKLSALLNSEYSRCSSADPARGAVGIAWLLEQLRAEANRMAPDAGLFSRRAEAAIAAISVSA